ncbi:MAG TPA: DUF2760 domain-containing protein [Desulfosalsimonadaceae bacterium]|nr:DUF2760 domain-containing protein [Desulfosalsimonadaceae bacterium]
MNIIKSFSRRSLAWILFFMLVLSALLNGALYWGWCVLTRVIPLNVLDKAAAQTPELQAGLNRLQPWTEFFKLYFIPISTAVLVIIGLILWLFLRGSLARQMRKNGLIEDKKSAPKKSKKKKVEGMPAKTEEKPQADKKAQRDLNQRYYLHLLSVLQREGRLVDFLEEDLNLYEDAQIGAAVRSIQDNCQKTVNKSLSPQPVLEKNEGDTVTVPADFDPASIKLTGHVGGEPPFTGVLRHRGWRAAKLELPTLSVSQDPRIIAPAEVEIQ